MTALDEKLVEHSHLRMQHLMLLRGDSSLWLKRRGVYVCPHAVVAVVSLLSACFQVI